MQSIVYTDSTQVLFPGNVGINILNNSTKICTFDCPYCYLGPTEIKVNQIKSELQFLSVEEVVEALASVLDERQALNKLPSAIEISGNGDPSLSSLLSEQIEAIRYERDKRSPKTRILFLTNGGNLDNKKIIQSLQGVDEVIVKLDAGDDRNFNIANKPLIRVNVSRIISACKSFENLSLQGHFFSGPNNNSSNEAIEEWIEVVGMIRPKKVYLMTTTQSPAVPDVLPVEEDLLYVIASKLKRRTEITAEVL
ncbi:MAG: radical SAM protein [Bdellovibrionales bacterium]|nr:radical SAM protein [Bdellovibrionales bacterium]